MRRLISLQQRTADASPAEVDRNRDQALKELQDAVRSIPVSARQFLKRQTFTSSGTYTPTVGARAAFVRLVGGGGGGGGVTNGANVAAGGGGHSGVYLERWIESVTQLMGGAVSVGAAGAAGTAGNNGGAGGTTTLSINGITLSASGGPGGVAMTNGSSATITGTQSLATSTSNADLFQQAAGAIGLRMSATDYWPGAGGSSPFGAGGVTITAGNGVAASGYGSGGGGGASGGSNQTGGAGTAGLVVVEEYS